MKVLISLLATIFFVSCSTNSSSPLNPASRSSTESSESKTTVCQNTETSFKCVKVVEVYDGDTIFIDLPDQHPLFGRRMGVRILGIDTPEIRSKSTCEKKKAAEAKAALQKILNQASSVDIVNVQKDKFFRILGEVVADGQPVATSLIKMKLAYPYHGEKKIKRNWCL
ncbi:MAG: thermonuclease family protein [Bdellovibrio sp.]